MSMKTILVPMENHDALHSALDAALLLARRCNSHIAGFALRLPINLAAGVDMLGGMPLEQYSTDIEEEAKKARHIFESFMRDHNVPRSSQTSTSSPTFGWLDEAPEGESFVGSYGRVFDVIVMNTPNVNSRMYDGAHGMRLVRERSADLTSSTVVATADCQQRINRVEPQY